MCLKTGLNLSSHCCYLQSIAAHKYLTTPAEECRAKHFSCSWRCMKIHKSLGIETIVFSCVTVKACTTTYAYISHCGFGFCWFVRFCLIGFVCFVFKFNFPNAHPLWNIYLLHNVIRAQDKGLFIGIVKKF